MLKVIRYFVNQHIRDLIFDTLVHTVSLIDSA